MRLLHTGDWHLGKIFYDINLFDDQNYFIEQVLAELKLADSQGAPYGALCIPGDIYDRASPAIDAINMLNNFLCRVHNLFPSLHIFILSGNHDNPSRLGFGSELFELANVHICKDTKSIQKAVIVDNCAIYQLPFLSSGSFDDFGLNGALSQTELYSYAVQKILESHKKNHPDLPLVLCAHASVAACDEAEKLDSVGTLDFISGNIFSEFTYIALGHIHKFQKVAPNAYYSGSPLAYSFDDVPKKYMLRVDIDSKFERGFNVTKIEIKPLHQVIQFKTDFFDLYNNDYSWCKDYYIQLIRTDFENIPDAKKILKQKFPLLLSIVREELSSGNSSSSLLIKKNALKNNGALSAEEAFSSFMEEMYGKENIPELFEEEKKLFIELYKTCSEEEV